VVHDVPKQEIKRLKHRHHPSRKVGLFEGLEGKKMEDCLTDSEAEGREDLEDNREYLCTHEDWYSKAELSSHAIYSFTTTRIVRKP
jgi:hypothetical protein